jgi:hypothetical protein
LLRKADAAKNWFRSAWFERDGGIDAALEAFDSGFSSQPSRRSFGFAVLTPLGIICESLFAEESLFVRRKSKHRAASNTHQLFVNEIHTLSNR